MLSKQNAADNMFCCLAPHKGGRAVAAAPLLPAGAPRRSLTPSPGGGTGTSEPGPTEQGDQQYLEKSSLLGVLCM